MGCKLHLGQQIKLHGVVTESSSIELKGCLTSASGHWLFWCLGDQAPRRAFKVQHFKPKPLDDICLNSESCFLHQGSRVCESNNSPSLQTLRLCVCVGTKEEDGDMFLCSLVSPTTCVSLLPC